jgi:nucleoside-diphosphate-sugar epimerase
MRAVVLGGTSFIGRRITEDLLARGDEVTVVHRGVTEPPGWAECRHLHAARADFATIAADVRALRPDAIVDTRAMTRADAEAVLPHLPDARLVLLSSMDVYRAFELLHSPDVTEPMPVSEDSPLRVGRYPHRGEIEGAEDYEKLDVEPAYAQRGGTVLRLAMIYGEHDPQRREEFLLRRVRAGRRRIPVGPGNWLWTRCYVGDVASAVLAALATPAAQGQVLNIGEPVTATTLGWARQILAAAGHDAELVGVPEGVLPGDMWPTKGYAQHLLVDSHRAMDLLGWRPGSPREAIARSVRWHLANPPQDAGPDFTDDDKALAASETPSRDVHPQ